MPRTVTVRRPEARRFVKVTLPRSKSMANRAMMLDAISGGAQRNAGMTDADDVRILQRLVLERPVVMDCGAGGTTFRFILAWACTLEGEEHIITGGKHLLERPHGELLRALRVLGGDIESVPEGYKVRGRRMPGGTVSLDSPVSSQYISALLLIAPCFTQGLHLRWTGRRLSVPYVRLTLSMLRERGVDVNEDQGGIVVLPGLPFLHPGAIPLDWSAAAFWFEVMALGGVERLCLSALHPGTGQGDEECLLLWAPMVMAEDTSNGILLDQRAADPQSPLPLTFDLTATPDLFQPLAFTCAALGLPAVFAGLDNLPLKETDRLAAVAQAMDRLGCVTDRVGTSFTILQGVTNAAPSVFDPQGDHRMAMALAPLAMVCEAVSILHPEVVDKSYPQFWEEMERAGFAVKFTEVD